MPKVKRFVIFEIWTYYPTGGWSDKKANFDTDQEVQDWLLNEADRSDWCNYEVVDLETGDLRTFTGADIKMQA